MSARTLLQPVASGPTSPPISIVVVDDHRFMRELISAMLARQEGRYEVVAEKGDAATAIQACQQHAPDLVANLPPGNYTAIVRGKNGGTGVGLVEVFALQ